MRPPEPLRGICPFCGEIIDPLTHARTIVEQVASLHRVPLDDIYGPSRKAYIVAARACAIRAIREATDLKLTAIGNIFGFNHATVWYHLNQNGATDAAAAHSKAVNG